MHIISRNAISCSLPNFIIFFLYLGKFCDEIPNIASLYLKTMKRHVPTFTQNQHSQHSTSQLHLTISFMDIQTLLLNKLYPY